MARRGLLAAIAALGVALSAPALADAAPPKPGALACARLVDYVSRQTYGEPVNVRVAAEFPYRGCALLSMTVSGTLRSSWSFPYRGGECDRPASGEVSGTQVIRFRGRGLGSFSSFDLRPNRGRAQIGLESLLDARPAVTVNRTGPSEYPVACLEWNVPPPRRSDCGVRTGNFGAMSVGAALASIAGRRFRVSRHLDPTGTRLKFGNVQPVFAADPQPAGSTYEACVFLAEGPVSAVAGAGGIPEVEIGAFVPAHYLASGFRPRTFTVRREWTEIRRRMAQSGFLNGTITSTHALELEVRISRVARYVPPRGQTFLNPPR